MVLNPTRPYRPKDKAHVERTVQLVYEQIFFPMRDEVFFSLHELNERIAELLEKFNNRKYSQLNISRRELFLTTEYPTLKTLPPEP
jgi:transposase